MRVLDLFSGIGGFSLGLERAGFETVAFCEYDEKCRKVLTKHWPKVKQYNDVRTLTAKDLEDDGITDIGLICGGYPCQPFSTAGKRAGEKDDRHLWPEFFRLIREIKPDWIVCENVAGHISMGLDLVLADLESEGYQCQTFLIPACAVGANHRRDRLWIIASSSSANAAESFGEQEARQEPEFGGDFIKKIPTDTDSRQRKVGRDLAGMGRDGESVKGYGYGGIADKPYLCRKDDDVPRRMDRLRQLGNSVVPQIPEMIGRAIMESEA